MGLNFNGTGIEKVNFNGVEVNKVVFNGTTVWEKQSTITSARFFTFDGEVCTGYVGDNNVSKIIIPRSYSKDADGNFIDGNDYQVTKVGAEMTESGFINYTGNVVLQDNITSINAYTFSGCSSLQSITIGEGVTKIGSYAFRYCYSLQSITIPDNVTSIDNDAFNGCRSLQSITIPDSVTYIGHWAFSGCSSLTEMTIEATTPPTLGGTNSISTATKIIYIPTGTLEAYQTANVWKELSVEFVEKEMWRVVYENSTGEEFYTISSTPVVKEFYVPSVFRTRRTRISGKGYSYNAFNKITFDNIELNTTNYTFVVTDYPLASKGAPQFAMIGAFDGRINVKVQGALNSFGGYATAGIKINKVEQYY